MPAASPSPSQRPRRGALRVLVAFAALLAFSHLLAHWVARAAEARGSRRIRVRLAKAGELTLTGPRFVLSCSARRSIAPGPLRLTAEGGLVRIEGPPSGRPSQARRVRIAWRGPAHLRSARGPAAATERLVYGSLEVKARGGELEPILHLPLELYLTGVLAAEMGPDFPLEALKAQAVAARSYALAAARRNRHRAHDLFADARSQAFAGVVLDPRLLEAVRATRGEVLLWRGRVLRAYYHSTCGGRTRDGRACFHDVPAPPFRPAACPEDRISPFHRWRRLWAKAGIEALGLRFEAQTFRLEVLERSERGDWLRLRIRSVPGAWRVLGGTRLRRLARLPSQWIESWRALPGRGVLFCGRGFGHGVGLCQFGAAGMARAGADYRTILARYYPGAGLGRAPQS